METLNEKDGFTEHNDELAACALINLENVGRLVPGLAQHGIYLIAHAQLKALSNRLNA